MEHTLPNTGCNVYALSVLTPIGNASGPHTGA